MQNITDKLNRLFELEGSEELTTKEYFQLLLGGMILVPAAIFLVSFLF